MYVACFSRDHDKLSQWRGYTPKASGACVAFDSFNLTNSGLEYMPLYDVIYDKDRQVGLIAAILGIVGEQYSRNKEADNLNKIMDSIVIIAIRQLQIILTVTKSHFWQEENEIRWILDLSASKNLRHLIHKMPTTVDIKIDRAIPIPIIGVTLGPSSNTDDRVKDINSLLNSREFKEKILHFSEIPLRY